MKHAPLEVNENCRDLLNLQENKICYKTKIPMIVLSLINQHLMRRRSKLTKKEQHNAFALKTGPSY